VSAPSELVLAVTPTEAPTLPTGLVFGTDEEPGLRRLGPRRQFRYADAITGEPVDDERTLERIRALVIPPAWRDVWIARDPRCHLQATGRDARGRKQYRYHPDYRAHQEEAKFELLAPFGVALPHLRRDVDRDLRRRRLTHERVTALAVRLLEETFVRVGNEEYRKLNGSYGLTTLRDRHLVPDGSSMRLRFRGKSAKVHDVPVDDPRLVRMLRQCQDLPGQVLLQYLTEDGRPCPLRSSDVNDYVRDHTGLDVTTKIFRTWGATLDAAVRLALLPPPESPTAGRRVVTAVVKEVAAELNNTPAVCRRSYIHPAIVDGYLDGTLRPCWDESGRRGPRALSADERRLLGVLAA
jgi:DNA topoisomerase-1